MTGNRDRHLWRFFVQVVRPHRGGYQMVKLPQICAEEAVMNQVDRQILWRQFAAALDMLGDALRACPNSLWEESLWKSPGGFSTFWYVGFHILFWVDVYLGGDEANFVPPAPFGLEEMDPNGKLPPRTYTREELLGYLAHCRQKCKEVIEALPDGRAYQLCRYAWGELPFTELLLDNLRHVQEHGAQLRMFLGQREEISARWIARAL